MLIALETPALPESRETDLTLIWENPLGAKSSGGFNQDEEGAELIPESEIERLYGLTLHLRDIGKIPMQEES